jgi:hypothetical protein
MQAKDVLCYRKVGAGKSTVRRHYAKWREAQGIPVRCDNAECTFFSRPLTWNGKPLKPILDHANGNNTDNRPTNLRLLCPNCDSQLEVTRGGANRGRIEKSDGGFAIKSKLGKRDYIMPVEPGHFNLSGQRVSLVHRDALGKVKR